MNSAASRETKVQLVIVMADLCGELCQDIRGHCNWSQFRVWEGMEIEELGALFLGNKTHSSCGVSCCE